MDLAIRLPPLRICVSFQVAGFGLSVASDNQTHASHMFFVTPFYIAPETQVNPFIGT